MANRKKKKGSNVRLAEKKSAPNHESIDKEEGLRGKKGNESLPPRKGKRRGKLPLLPREKSPTSMFEKEPD